MQPTPFVYSKEELAKSVNAPDIRDMLAVPFSLRNLGWLQRMLQYAIELEFSTIPPYLVAMWSIRDLGDPVYDLISGVVHQEMLHMGLVCNILNAVGGTPSISSPRHVPKYPRRGLPGGVHPGLDVYLAPLSPTVVSELFMVIEEPQSGPIVWSAGRTYPTIGAFYDAIDSHLATLSDADFKGGHQVVYTYSNFGLTAIDTVKTARDAINVIKEQGEGTSASPQYGPDPNDIAHYYVFGEILHEHVIQEVAPGKWCYNGDSLPFPTGIRQFTQAPSKSTDSLAFNTKFEAMLAELQTAWASSGDVSLALRMMAELGSLAVSLMDMKKLCPNFEIT